MSADKRHPPNPYLRREREMRNWTLADTARALRNLMASYGETQPGVTMFSVSRWELGFRRPAKLYRRYLCLLFAKRPDELGFLPRECAELAQTWPDEFSYEAVSTAVAAPPRVFHHSGVATPAGRPSQSVAEYRAAARIDSDGELEALNLTRRQLLAASGYFGAAASTEALGRVAEPIERAVRVASGQAAADNAMIDDLRAFNIRFDRVRRRAASGLLVEPVRSHIELLKGVLQQSLLPEQREAVLAEASHACRLMALLLADQGDRAGHRRWVLDSIAMGNETSDVALHVDGLLLAAEAELWMEGGESYKALRLLSHAHELARRACSPNVQSWVLAAQAYGLATVRRTKDVPRLLDLAAQAQQRSRPGYEPWWAEFWGRAKVSEYYGVVNLQLERPGPARAAFRRALAELPPESVKLRTRHVADLALTYAQQDEVEQACELAGQVLDLPLEMQYAATLDRVRKVRRRLNRRQTHRAVQALDERLRAVGAATA